MAIFGGGVQWGGGVIITSQALTAVVNSPFTVTTEVGLPISAVGSVRPLTANSDTGTGPYTYFIQSGTLPPGLALDPDTGTVVGTVQSNPGVNLPVVFAVSDSNGYVCPTTNTVTFRTNDAIQAVDLSSTQYIELGLPFGGTTPLVAFNGVGAYTYFVQSGTLPSGLTLNPLTGLISGTPTSVTTGTPVTVTFAVRDSYLTATTTATINFVGYNFITAVANNTAQLTEVGITPAAFAPLVASNGSGVYTYSVDPATPLPAGFSIDPSTGIVRGTPTSSSFGTRNVKFIVRDSLGAQATTFALVSYTVYPALTATVSNSPIVAEVGTAITSFNPLTAAGGTGTYIYKVVTVPLLTGNSNALPAGITINALTGLVSGTPQLSAANTTANVVFAVQDTLGASAPYTQVNFTIDAAITATATPSTQIFSINVPITSFTPIVAAGGTGVYTYYVSSGTLPTGLILNSNGVVTGTPTVAAAAANVVFRVRDTINIAATTSTVNIAINQPITAVANTYVTQSLAVAYTLNNFRPLVASGGTPPYNYRVNSGTLPAGLTLNSTTGVVSGTLTNVAGPSSVTFGVQDNNLFTAANTVSVTFSVAAGITSTVTNDVYNYTTNQAITPFTPITATGGVPPYTYSVIQRLNVNTGLLSPLLPTGITINSSTGVVSGTPTVVVYPSGTVWFKVVDSLGMSDLQYSSALIDVTAPFVVTAAPTAQTLEVGRPYSFRPFASNVGGATPYTYTITSGTVPDGLTFNANGSVTGTPTTVRITSVAFQISDLDGRTFNTEPIFTVNAGLSVSTAGSQSFTIGMAITSFSPITASNGVGPYTYSIASGTLPAGISYTSGVLSGTPTAAYSGSVTFRATDSFGATADGTVSFNAVSGPYTVNYVVVAGGGSGGYYYNLGVNGGGGGGGGVIHGCYTQNPGTMLTIVVGGGGAANCYGNNGSNSSLSGATTAIGGGGGGGLPPTNIVPHACGNSGGSGGGGMSATPTSQGPASPFYLSQPVTPGTATPRAARAYCGGAGIPGQGNAGSKGGSGGSTGFGGGGGGWGGAGGVGLIGPQGGPGYSWPFNSGTIVGGGGDGTSFPSRTGTNPSGGGYYLQNGATNRGGGGGAQGYGLGAGGSGVVILAVPTAAYPGSAPPAAVATASSTPGFTILKYTTSGTYTV